MRFIGMLIIFTWLVLVVLGCGGQTTPSKVVFPTVEPTVTLTPVPNIWQVYSYTRTTPPVFTFSVEYPTIRQAEVISQDTWLAQVDFFLPITNQVTSNNQNMGLAFYALPYKHRSNADPRYANPNFPDFNMGGGVTWFEPIQVAGADGLLYVVFDTNSYSADTYRMYSLNMVAYQRDIEASIQAGINFSPDDWVMVTQRGFTETIHKRFQSFIHMVKSIKVVSDPSLIKPTPTPIFQPLPQPPTATTWITEDLGGVLIEYPAEWQILDYYTGNGSTDMRFTLPVDGGVTNIPTNYVIRYGYALIQPSQPMTRQDFQSNDYRQVEWEEQLSVAGADGSIMQVVREEDILKLVGTVYRNLSDNQPNTPLGVAIGFSTILDTESLAMARTQDLTQTIAKRFQLFRHMVENVKFLEH